MNSEFRLHYAPDNASLCVRIALLEMNLTFDPVLVNRKQRAQKSAQFLAMNPNGLIPVLETPDGPMFETAAILQWLADREQVMMPPQDSPARVPALQWLFWLSNTLHGTLRMLFYPDQYGADDPEKLRLVTRARLIAQLDLLENATTAPWRDGDTPSIHGCYLAPMLRWSALYGGSTDWFDLSRWPHLQAFAKRIETRPAVIAAAKSEGLGSTPISAPSPCVPPEGSAL
ncbi:glutathione S-transferase family protein [Yoonia sp. I 8.24]|uniref:glutathione S-transferase family protein n=1 Tax=Yoonia sp. I 8.24 TaxID=1537229 RepID=UPI001EDDEF89|nr:glutathione S-transferase family protein [Yoonia sp. I 8.24]MCG3267221.1 glutathione S-transferase family protein [Yoonia sp. I 8.24]